MDISTHKSIFNTKLSIEEFNRLSVYINTNFGIKMPPEKKIMLQSRLQKRLRDLNIATFKEYIDLVFSENGVTSELIHMIDVVTTNKTDFFREAAHFDYITNEVLPLINGKQIKIWSAGCSSGEEVYTIAIILKEFLQNNNRFDFQILGTDISSRVLAKAVEAIYTEERIANIPIELKKKYFLKSKDRLNPAVRVIKDLRSKASFLRLNFMDSDYAVVKEMFDIIFCRNVLIYFDRPTQEKVISRLCQKLKYGGYFFLGHSESIMGMNLPLKQIRPTIFVKI
ncbi:MAG: CheR family methyltransferase [Cyclobacteriaceae bacterium]